MEDEIELEGRRKPTTNNKPPPPAVCDENATCVSNNVTLPDNTTAIFEKCQCMEGFFGSGKVDGCRYVADECNDACQDRYSRNLKYSSFIRKKILITFYENIQILGIKISTFRSRKSKQFCSIIRNVDKYCEN